MISTRLLASRLGLPKKFYHHRMHELTDEQMNKLRDALGDSSDWPKHTDDPRVNYVIDCLVSYEDKPPQYWQVKQILVEEISAFAAMS